MKAKKVLDDNQIFDVEIDDEFSIVRCSKDSQLICEFSLAEFLEAVLKKYTSIKILL